MKEELAVLLDKYYRGETSPEEEKLLKEGILAEKDPSSEKEFFTWCKAEAQIPADLDEHVFDRVNSEVRKRKTRFSIYSLASIAATFALVVTLYSGYQTGQKNELDFRLIEQALYNISETLQPEPAEPEMLVLWVDHNVEIIVN